jgi:hypothetical protein
MARQRRQTVTQHRSLRVRGTGPVDVTRYAGGIEKPSQVAQHELAQTVAVDDTCICGLDARIGFVVGQPVEQCGLQSILRTEIGHAVLQAR